MIKHIDMTKRRIDIVLNQISIRVLEDIYYTVLGQLSQQLVKQYRQIDMFFIFLKICELSTFDHLYRKQRSQ